MPDTPTPAESFISLEEPLVTTQCPRCSLFVKQGMQRGGEVALLDFPLQIRTIKVFESGRIFVSVRSHFLHTHAEAGH